MGKRELQNKRSFEQVEQGDDPMNGLKGEQMEIADDSNNNADNKSAQLKKNMKKEQQMEQANAKHEDEEFEDADDEEQDDEEDVIEEEEEIEEEVEEEEDDDEDEDEALETEDKEQKTSANKNDGQSSSGQQNSGNSNAGANNADKRPRLTDELYQMNLRRKKEHVGSALYIPFPRKVNEEEVRSFVGQGPNIFLVGPQKQNAIVRYRTQSDCEKQQAELAKKEFDGQTLNIEPKTVKIDPANIDVKTLIVQYSNPDLTIMDFAQIFIKAISISLKGGKSKKESQEDLSFGSAIIIFPSHDEAKEAFLATENLNIKGEQLRVVFADFRPAGAGPRPVGFRNKGGENNRGNFNRGNNQGRPGGGGGGGGGGGNFRNRNRQGGPRNFGNRNFNQNSGGDRGGNYNQGGGRNYSPNKKFRSNVR